MQDETEKRRRDKREYGVERERFCFSIVDTTIACPVDGNFSFLKILKKKSIFLFVDIFTDFIGDARFTKTRNYRRHAVAGQGGYGQGRPKIRAEPGRHF